MMLTLLARCNVKAFSQKEKRKGKAVSSVVVLLAAENTRHKQPWQGRGYFLFRGFDPEVARSIQMGTVWQTVGQ